MTTNRKKKPTYVTPQGRTSWAKVFHPDTKFNADGEYSLKLTIDNQDAQELTNFLDEQMEKAIDSAVEETGKARGKIKTVEPYSVDDETGDVTIKVKLRAKGKTRDGEVFTQKPQVFDAKRQPVTSEVPLWNGSIVKVAYQPVTYYTGLAGAGVSLRLKAVQIIEAVGGSSEASLFGDEDGFSFDASTTTTQPETMEEHVDPTDF